MKELRWVKKRCPLAVGDWYARLVANVAAMQQAGHNSKHGISRWIFLGVTRHYDSLADT